MSSDSVMDPSASSSTTTPEESLHLPTADTTASATTAATAADEFNPTGQAAATVLGYETIKRIQELSEEFDELCQKRYNMGEQKYGPGTWLGIDNLEMAVEELIDMANYLRFAFVKFRLLQEYLETDRSTAAAKPGNEMMGKDAFMSAVRRSE